MKAAHDASAAPEPAGARAAGGDRRRGAVGAAAAPRCPALVAVAFLVLPLAGLLIRAPWGDLWEILHGSQAGEALQAVAVDLDGRDRDLAGHRRAAGLGAGPDRRSPGCGCCGRWSPCRWCCRRWSAVSRCCWRSAATGSSAVPRPVVRHHASRSRPLAVIMAETFVAMPFLIVTVEGALRSADRGFEEAAATLGAKRMTVFRRITAPLVAPSLGAGAVLCWARALGEFGATITFAGSFPGRTQTMPIAVYYALETRPGRGHRAQPGAAARVGDRAGRRCATSGSAGARPSEPIQRPPIEHGLAVDAEVSRGEFTLRVALSAAPGEVLGVLGPNGSGKSTLLAAVAGLIPVSSGQILLDGTGRRRRRHRRVPRGRGPPGRLRVPGLPAVPAPERARQCRLLAPGPRSWAGTTPRGAATGWLDRLGLTELADRRPGRPVRRPGPARGPGPCPGRRPRPAAARRAAVRARRPHPPRRADRAQPPPGRLRRPVPAGHPRPARGARARRPAPRPRGRPDRPGGHARRGRPAPGHRVRRRLVGLNLYPGTVDGARVELAAAVHSSCPTTASTATCSSRCAPRPWSSARRHPRTERAQHLAGDHRRADPAHRPGPARPRGRAVGAGRRHPGSRLRARPSVRGQVWLAAKATDLSVYSYAEPGDGSRA